VTGESLYPRDLIERLRAELDRLEAIAVAAAECARPPWTAEAEAWERTTSAYLRDADGNAQGESCGCCSTGTLAPAVAAHAAAFDPAHVLRTIQAHRQLVDEHDGTDFPFDPEGSAHGSYSWTPHCVGCGQEEPCSTLRALASIYFLESDAT
jgi:hypothetical protein